MDSFIHVAGWSQHHRPSSRSSSARPLGHFRSLSSVAATTQSSPPSPGPQKARLPLKSTSTSHLPTISLTESVSTSAAVDDEMSTLPDPRSRSRSPSHDNGEASPDHHPDLNNEVATLSTKLINAINYQTVLDDTLSSTRHELSTARERIQQLEQHNAALRDTIQGDVWVRRATLEAERKHQQAEKRAVQAKLAEETSRRLDTEQGKRKIEQELENLTAALFEEANKMVVAAKEEAQAQHDALQRKNDQLKSQLADSESLLKSQQEQLSELKSVMETMASEHDDQSYGTAPPSPAVDKFDNKEHDRRAVPDPADSTPTATDISAPCPPTSLPHLLQPILRNDLPAFEDFMSLAKISHTKHSPTRVSSGSLGGLNALALGLGGSTSSAHLSNASTTSLTAVSTPVDKSAPQSPITPASTTSAGSTNASGVPIPPLKETRFYKRALTEDIEPTLRLDIAPGLSWLARRTVLSSMTEGSLVVEPIPASATYIAIAKPQLHPCTLCGESRKEPLYLRNHRFRTSESDSAQRYPLCNYCLNRVRSTCDFLGFLRMVKDGHWRADDEDQEKAAWEESVKLREHMFWARIGGGVVPASHAGVSLHASEADQGSRLGEEASQSVVKPGHSTPDNKSRENIANFKPQTPPGQTEGGHDMRVSVQSTDSQSTGGSETTEKEVATA